jgi:F-type H+-transporting ATPase subunit alpha
LESFAQFGSDLDAATQQQLVRGSRLIEILKQKQYEPLPVEKQIMIIFAANGGFLDDINESDLAAFESELYAYTETKDESLLNDIREQSKLDDALEGRLEKVIADFKNVFVK